MNGKYKREKRRWKKREIWRNTIPVRIITDTYLKAFQFALTHDKYFTEMADDVDVLYLRKKNLKKKKKTFIIHCILRHFIFFPSSYTTRFAFFYFLRIKGTTKRCTKHKKSVSQQEQKYNEYTTEARDEDYLFNILCNIMCFMSIIWLRTNMEKFSSRSFFFFFFFLFFCLPLEEKFSPHDLVFHFLWLNKLIQSNHVLCLFTFGIKENYLKLVIKPIINKL